VKVSCKCSVRHKICVYFRRKSETEHLVNYNKNCNVFSNFLGLLHSSIFDNRRPIFCSARGHDTTTAAKRTSQHYTTPQQMVLQTIKKQKLLLWRSWTQNLKTIHMYLALTPVLCTTSITQTQNRTKQRSVYTYILDLVQINNPPL